METTAGSQEMPLRYLYNGEYRADSYISSRVATYQAARQGNFDNTWPWANWQNYYATLRNINNLLYYGKNIPDNRFSSVQAKTGCLAKGIFCGPSCISTWSGFGKTWCCAPNQRWTPKAT